MNGRRATPLESVGDSPRIAYRSPRRSDRIQNSTGASLTGLPSGSVSRAASTSATSGRDEGSREIEMVGDGLSAAKETEEIKSTRPADTVATTVDRRRRVILLHLATRQSPRSRSPTTPG